MGIGIKRKLRGVHRKALHLVGVAKQRARPIFGRPGVRVLAAFHSPTDMCDPDRMFIYTMVRCLMPTNCIEIGTRWGGSARTICAALEDNQRGRLVGIDPVTSAFIAPKRSLFGRFTAFRGYSPQDVPAAVEETGLGPIDLAFIDGMHTYTSVSRDLDGLAPFLSPGAMILLHDAFHPGIARAADEFIERHPEAIDVGLMTRHPKFIEGRAIGYQGIRVIRFGDDNQIVMRDGYQRSGASFPEDPGYYLDFDNFAARQGLVRETEQGWRWIQDEGESHLQQTQATAEN